MIGPRTPKALFAFKVIKYLSQKGDIILLIDLEHPSLKGISLYEASLDDLEFLSKEYLEHELKYKGRFLCARFSEFNIDTNGLSTLFMEAPTEVNFSQMKIPYDCVAVAAALSQEHGTLTGVNLHGLEKSELISEDPDSLAHEMLNPVDVVDVKTFIFFAGQAFQELSDKYDALFDTSPKAEKEKALRRLKSELTFKLQNVNEALAKAKTQRPHSRRSIINQINAILNSFRTDQGPKFEVETESDFPSFEPGSFLLLEGRNKELSKAFEDLSSITKIELEEFPIYQIDLLDILSLQAHLGFIEIQVFVGDVDEFGLPISSQEEASTPFTFIEEEPEEYTPTMRTLKIPLNAILGVHLRFSDFLGTHFTEKTLKDCGLLEKFVVQRMFARGLKGIQVSEMRCLIPENASRYPEIFSPKEIRTEATFKTLEEYKCLLVAVLKMLT